METASLILIATPLLSVVAAIVAALSWRAAHQSSQFAAVGTYAAINKDFLEHIDVLNPLTPYPPVGRDHTPLEKEALIRVSLLGTLSRFRFAANRQEKRLHVEFRECVMGSSLAEFRQLILKRGGSSDLAALAPRVLREIHDREPYFGRRFWRTYFGGFDWDTRDWVDE